MTPEQIEEAAIEDACRAYNRAYGKPVVEQFSAMRAAIEAYNAAMWRPIEGAPKDGSRALLYGGSVVIGYWREDCEHGSHETGPGWQTYSCEDEWYSTSINPTDFRPLPKPPEKP